MSKSTIEFPGPIRDGEKTGIICRNCGSKAAGMKRIDVVYVLGRWRDQYRCDLCHVVTQVDAYPGD